MSTHLNRQAGTPGAPTMIRNIAPGSAAGLGRAIDSRHRSGAGAYEPVSVARDPSLNDAAAQRRIQHNAEARALALDLVAAGFNAPGVSVDDLQRLGPDRLRELQATMANDAAFAAYSMNDMLAEGGGVTGGDMLRLVTAVRAALQGASTEALAGLGEALLKSILKQVAPAQSTMAGNGADPYADYPDNPGLEHLMSAGRSSAAGDEFAGYSLNEHL
ncbi:hypothetical protein [Rubrivivax albus]|uniref:Uncharacterized protein n=1 Tax=Rubrivivax albus TaxID=2499835 RepID=A0A437JNG0_9BURK|nr:hypothetical protein [Rubrivivax albus]RVT48394.1 hypothetical protein ENE75_22115 [Rubrivivax albus]